MNRLTGKRTLITGGTTGIGLETAKQFLAEGARVAITGTNAANLATAQEALGKDVIVIHSEAGDVQAQAALAAKIKQAFGGLDAVFINAGVGDFRPIEAFDGAGFDRTLLFNSGFATDTRKPRIYRAQYLYQCAHRHAEFERLCGFQSRVNLNGKNPVWRADRQRHSSQCG
jgi:NAD(P)-dependent dehydrogenase (short-subunit alcohol dehydrogenase family)